MRARFCELLSEKGPKTIDDPFLLGLMSMMDKFLEIPMRDVLQKIQLDQQTKAVFSVGEDAPSPNYRLMRAPEAGDWERRERCRRNCTLAKAYLENCGGRQCSGRGR